MRLPRDFYFQSTKKVAKELLGKHLVLKEATTLKRYQIVETEAYLGLRDAACHSYHGKRTPRVDAMYKPGGFSYVYLIYGMYFCFNVVTKDEATPEAVLIRALYEEGSSAKTLAGPGKLCRELGITKKDNSIDLTVSNRIWIEDTSIKPKIVATQRIGVDYAGKDALLPLRFYIKDHPAISKK